MRRAFGAAAGLVSVVVVVTGCGGGGATTSSASRTAAGRSSSDVPVLRAGEQPTFPAGELATGSTIACVSNGVRAEAQVPEADGNLSTSGHAWTKGAGASITIAALASGDVKASCE